MRSSLINMIIYFNSVKKLATVANLHKSRLSVLRPSLSESRQGTGIIHGRNSYRIEPHIGAVFPAM
jgi:hypothetical protein